MRFVLRLMDNRSDYYNSAKPRSLGGSSALNRSQSLAKAGSGGFINK